MADLNDAPIDDILKSIRETIVEKERKQYFKSFYPAGSRVLQPEDEVFELSRNMLVKREDIPYQLGVWSFDDVAKKMMKKYRSYFNLRPQQVKNGSVRVCVKKDA